MTRPWKIAFGRQTFRVRNLAQGAILLAFMIGGGSMLGRALFAWNTDRIMPYQLSPLVRRVEIPAFQPDQFVVPAPAESQVAAPLKRPETLARGQAMRGAKGGRLPAARTREPVLVNAFGSERREKPLGAYVIASFANIRLEPKAAAEKVGSALKGEIAELAGRKNGWSLLVFRDRGISGWVRDDLFAVFDQPGG